MKTPISAVPAGSLLAALALSVGAHAAPLINGEISFLGGASLDNTIGTAIQFTSIYSPVYGTPHGPMVSAVSGSYLAITPGLGTEATFSSFAFSGSPFAVTPLFSITTGGETYSFDATSITSFYQDANFINISGTGVAHITGTTTYADTVGTWKITLTGATTTQKDGTFGAYIVVPEPAMASLLFGFGFVAWLRRRITTR